MLQTRRGFRRNERLVLLILRGERWLVVGHAVNYHDARLAATPLRPNFSGSCARPCGSERASGSIIDGPMGLGKRGRLRVDQPTITG
jgi:hypothetical protein